MRNGYASALTAGLSELNSNGHISNEYIIEIYGYCRGMNYEFLKKPLEGIMDELTIDY